MGFGGIDKELYLEFSEFFYSLGFFGELIMVFLVTALLWNRIGGTGDLLIYFIGLIVNQVFNRLLKPLLKSPRPSDPIKFLASEHFMKNSNAYGMPSGHSQSVFFSLTYLYFVIGKFYPWLCFASLIGFATICERYIYHNHTLMQLFVGALVGTVIGYTVFEAKKIIKISL